MCNSVTTIFQSVMKKQRSDVVQPALTTREDLFVGAVKGQTEDVGQVLSLQFHRLGPSVDGFLHVPQEHPAVVSSWGGHDKKTSLQKVSPRAAASTFLAADCLK